MVGFVKTIFIANLLMSKALKNSENRSMSVAVMTKNGAYLF